MLFVPEQAGSTLQFRRDSMLQEALSLAEIFPVLEQMREKRMQHSSFILELLYHKEEQYSIEEIDRDRPKARRAERIEWNQRKPCLKKLSAVSW